TVFYAPMIAANEVPAVTTSTSTGGEAKLTVSGAAGAYSIAYSITVNGLNSPQQAHIHTGAATATGPVRVWLCGAASLAPPAGSPDCAGSAGNVVTGSLVSGTVNTTVAGGISMDSVVSLMRSGGAYVNVHTTANAGGEIRGQITSVTTP